MTFNSYIFVLVFLPIAVCGYYFLVNYWSHTSGKVFLFLMSLWFYGYFNWKYLVIFIVSILGNYLAVQLIAQSASNTKRRFYFGLGLLLNLGLLFLFKYYDFFVENMNFLFHSNFVMFHLILPLGISFFTFQQLSYLIDVYKGEASVYKFVDYAVYISFFPQLVAGPIVLHDEFLPQINKRENWKFNSANFSKGVYGFILGLAKKVLWADLLGLMVNWGFGNVGELSGLDVLIMMILYTMQIYFDFSGYSDMASGIGLMFNIQLPINFDSPYKTCNIVEFWKKWHMTLTRFFTKYVYIPMGGNRKGTIRQYINIFVVFLISGFWHGANWTFVLWGILHGIANLVYRIGEKGFERVPRKLMWFANAIFLNITWLIFRSDSIGQAGAMLGKLGAGEWLKKSFWNLSTTMLKSNDILEYKILYRMLMPFLSNMEWVSIIMIMAILLISIYMVLVPRNVQQKMRTFQPTIGNMIGISALLMYIVCSLTAQSTFLYFNF